MDDLENFPTIMEDMNMAVFDLYLKGNDSIEDTPIFHEKKHDYGRKNQNKSKSLLSKSRRFLRKPSQFQKHVRF